MVYDFDENGYLKPQRIYKTDLAAFYNVSGRQFRRELLNVLPVNTRKQMFSIGEVAKIFEKLGRITRSEVQNARNNLRI